MKLYEINKAIESLVDEETGEILDFDKFSELQIARDEKIENMALWVKNLEAEAAAIKAEKDNLSEREKACKNKAESLKNYLSSLLGGEIFKTPKVACSFRKSVSTEIDDGFVEWAKANDASLLKYKEPDVDKTAVKKAIQDGAEFELARLVEKQNLQIK